MYVDPTGMTTSLEDIKARCFAMNNGKATATANHHVISLAVESSAKSWRSRVARAQPWYFSSECSKMGLDSPYNKVTIDVECHKIVHTTEYYAALAEVLEDLTECMDAIDAAIKWFVKGFGGKPM